MSRRKTDILCGFGRLGASVLTQSNMEPQQIKSEITALQARFDALRGYL